MQFHKWEVCIGTCMRDYLSPAILYFLYRVLRELVFAHPSSNHPNSLKQIFQSSARYQLLRFAPFNKSRRERKIFTSLYRRDIFDRFLIAPDFPNIFLREQSTRTNHPERRIELRISSVEEKKKKRRKRIQISSPNKPEPSCFRHSKAEVRSEGEYRLLDDPVTRATTMSSLSAPSPAIGPLFPPLFLSLPLATRMFRSSLESALSLLPLAVVARSVSTLLPGLPLS